LGGGKKNRKPPPRVAELEEIVSRHKEHMGRLEKVLRCIDNETIHPDELEDLKTDMEMYLVGRGWHCVCLAHTCACASMHGQSGPPDDLGQHLLL